MVDRRELALREQPIPSLLFKMATPAIIGMLVMSVYNFVDAIFMGMLGTDALAAATVGYPYFILLTSIGLMFGIGGGAYQSILLGKGEKDKAEKCLSVVLITSIITALIITIISLIFSKHIAIMFGATATLLDISNQYITILAAGAVFPLINMTCNNFLRSEGSAMYSLFGMILGSVVNIGLDPLFMFTFGLGVRGAAIATVISQAVSTMFLFGYYLMKKTVIKFKLSQFKPDKDIFKAVFKIGIPVFVQQIFATISMSIMNILAGNYGDNVVAAIGAFSRINMVAGAIIVGWAQGMQPIVGYNFGAKQFNRVKHSIDYSLKVTTLVCLFFSFIFIIFPNALGRLFTNDKEVISIVTIGLRWLAVPWPLLGLFFVIQTLFQALGRGRQATWLAIARQGVFLIPSLFILDRLYGLNGLMAALGVASFLSIGLAYALFAPFYKKIKHNFIDI